MRIAFFGTPDFAGKILTWVLKYSELEIVLVVSQPDKGVGRKKELQATPVKLVAFDAWIELLQLEKIKWNTEFVSRLENLELDFIVVVAYGKIIPKSILGIPKYGCINIHGSILPKYRWASPVQAAVKSWDAETGLTIMYMSEWMDEGDILQIQKVLIEPNDTSLDIFEKFTDIWPKFLRDTLQKVYNWEISGTPQEESSLTYCRKILREDGEVFFQKQGAQEIYDTFRAYTPWPGIFTWYEEKRLVLEEVKLFTWEFENAVEIGSFIKISKNRYGIMCSDWEILGIKRVKLEGKKSMDIVSFMNGNKQILENTFQ